MVLGLVEVLLEFLQDPLRRNGLAKLQVLPQTRLNHVIPRTNRRFIEEQDRAQVIAAIKTFRIVDIRRTDPPIEHLPAVDPLGLFLVDAETVHACLDHLVVVTWGEPNRLIVGAIVTPGFLSLPGIVGNPDEHIRKEFENVGLHRSRNAVSVFEPFPPIDMSQVAHFLSQKTVGGATLCGMWEKVVPRQGGEDRCAENR